MYNIGIDLGGTNIVVGVVDKNNNIIGKGERKTNIPRPAENIFEDMYAAALDALDQAGVSMKDVEYVGLGTPGAVEPETGVITYSANLFFHNVPAKKLLEERFGKMAFVGNDANCAAMAEAVAGAGKGAKDSVTITLGTGVGAGVIINGRIFSGFNQAGSEFGHTVLVSGGVQCGCGRKGCFEQYASASALARMTKEAAEANPDSLLNKVKEDFGEWNAQIAFVAMKQGDKVAEKVIDSYTDYLADGLANAINTFMPEVLVVGGGVCGEGDPLLIPMREKTMSRPYFGPGVKKTRIELAQMGNDAGIVGAAMMGKSCVDDGKNGK